MPENLFHPPCGLAGIIKTFGDVAASIEATGEPGREWQQKHLTRVKLPFAIPLAWDQSLRATRVHCHRKVASVLEVIFDEVEQKGMRSLMQTYGGCYCFRRKRGGRELSAHAWGIALDLNVESNRVGSEGDMDRRLVELFERHGFEWGGRWPEDRRDPMHFQFCRCY